MNEVTHRQLRNDSGEVLRRVAAGETILVTNHGRPAAVIGPPSAGVLEDLAAHGQLRAATASPTSLRTIRRKRSSRTSAEIVADTRGDR
jgi:prevent-host-death family protein